MTAHCLIKSCRPRLLILPLTIVTVLLIDLPAFPHGGGLDAYGCHHNRTHGGYHCHQGAFRGSMFDSQTAMLRQLEASTLAEMQEFSGRVVGVTDGDTITVMHSGVGERILLHGIDCPEKRQAFGSRAKQFASELAFGKTVTVQVVDYDRYKRTVGDVVLTDGRVLNHELVKAGMCWWYRKYAPDNEALKQLEKEAREAKRGLWVEPDAVPPWEWRIARKRDR